MSRVFHISQTSSTGTHTSTLLHGDPSDSLNPLQTHSLEGLPGLLFVLANLNGMDVGLGVVDGEVLD